MRQSVAFVEGKPLTFSPTFRGKVVPDWLCSRAEINPSAKLIYAYLLEYEQLYGVSDPTIAEIAIELSFSDRGVRRALKELEDHFLVHAEDRRSQSKSSVYTFLVHRWNKDSLELLSSEGGSSRKTAK